ncbi:peptidoglycan-associated lipoprotein Pal [Desulfosudis oleivorans]|uniref:Peptidoglycan-associated lipoprotein n=1 Tax=Desulfosudis oleivorans (strain DSM 6200 / JCM 39069 / Hxd3) TaxID=96561 RepID=A8ZUI1_DESOH|nr:peptidoglycan-associated lipoprotein Pal [Desulfosudis oleivorans]ABW68013.1 Peptidoglycan-associated lipoprotein [Desulfosudis oleivorans Hxd3]
MEKKRLFVMFVMLFAICGLLFTVSCAKQSVKSEATELETESSLAADEASQMAAEEMAEAEAIAAEKAAARHAFVNENIHFDFDKSTLTPAAREILRTKATWLRDNSDAAVVVEGHCDERGTTEYNLALGDRRAKAAKDFLVDMGISASRLSTISYGEERPLDPRSNETAWAKNRRAQFVLR